MRALLADASASTSLLRADVVHTAKITSAQVKQLREQTETLLKEREVFLRTQQLDLKRAAKDILNLQTRSVDTLRTQIQHEEERCACLMLGDCVCLLNDLRNLKFILPVQVS